MTATWTKTLRTLDPADLKSVFGCRSDVSRDARRLERERKFTTRTAQREFKNGLRVRNAIRLLERLPEPGETLHLVFSGSFDAFDVIPAMLTMAAPAVIENLGLASLGFNEKNTATLLRLLDKGQVKRCSFLCSIYFKSMEDGGCIFENLHRELTARGHQCKAVRSHAKIILAQFTDGRCFAWESSANLRSCRNCEQASLTADRELFLFHQQWMQEFLDG